MFRIPPSQKPFDSALFAELLPVSPADIDVDRMMPQLLELCVHLGYQQRSNTDDNGYDKYLDLLIEDENGNENDWVAGLDRQRRREILDGWIQSSIINFKTKTLSRTGRFMDYPRPITLATFRSGLPKSSSWNRGTGRLVYLSMLDELRRQGSVTPHRNLADMVTKSFSDGIDVGGEVSGTPQYDGTSPIDINALLALRFFDKFPGLTPAKAKNNDNDSLEIALPGAVDPIGRDCINLLLYFAPVLPSIEGTGHLASLISIRLFQLVLRTGVALRELFETKELSRDFLDSNSENNLEMFCDFTDGSNLLSDDLSRKCVQRDLEIVRKFLSDRILLKSLFFSAQLIDTLSAELKGLSITEKFKLLVENIDREEMSQALRLQIRQIEHSLDEVLKLRPTNGIEGRRVIHGAWDKMDAPDLVSYVLTQALQKDGLINQNKWFRTTGGLDKSYGVLFGNAKKVSWRYRVSDELLVSLLMLCFVDPDGGRVQTEIGMLELLRRLENRFGILVDKPPKKFDNAESRAASSANREAFVRKLQLLGCFEGLSDDYSAQFVHCPRVAVKYE